MAGNTVAFADDGAFIRADEAGVVRYINKRSLNMQHDRGMGFTLQSDDYKAYYDMNNVTSPAVAGVAELLETFQAWMQASSTGGGGGGGEVASEVVVLNTVSVTGSVQVAASSNVHSVQVTGGQVGVTAHNNVPIPIDGTVSIANIHRCPFGDLRVAERSLIMEVKSCFGISGLRDIVMTQAQGSVTNNPGDPEYQLLTSGGADHAELRTAERGRCIAGIGADVGIAVRVGALPTGSMVYDWGLFDEQNGFFFRLCSTGLSVVVRRAGVDAEIPQASFNGTPCNINMDDGHIYNIVFSWDGYGKVNFVVHNNVSSNAVLTVIHTYVPTSATSLENPNLPVSARIVNNGTAARGQLFVAGRQYSVIGKYNPLYRINSVVRVAAPVNSLANFTHVISVRRKQGYIGNGIKVSGLDAIASTNQIIQLRTGATLTGANFQPLQDQLDNETALQQDQSTSSVSGGVVIWTGIVDRSTAQRLEDFTYVLTEFKAVTVCAKAISQANGTLTCCLRLSEEW